MPLVPVAFWLAGMFIGQAKQLCPDLHILPYDFARIEALSGKLYAILCSQDPRVRVEPVSCDEAYLDISGANRVLHDSWCIMIGSATLEAVQICTT